MEKASGQLAKENIQWPCLPKSAQDALQWQIPRHSAVASGLGWACRRLSANVGDGLMNFLAKPQIASPSPTQRLWVDQGTPGRARLVWGSRRW